MGLPLLLTIACGIAWSAHDTLRKVLVAQIRPLALLVLLAGGAAPPFALWMALDPAQRASPPPSYLLPAAASVALNVAANLALLRGMRLAPLSVAVPLLSLTPAFTALAAIPPLGERPSPTDDAGSLLGVSGAIFLGTGRKDRLGKEENRTPGARPVEAVPRGSSEQALAIPVAGDTDPARSEAQARASDPAGSKARAGTSGDRLHRPLTNGPSSRFSREGAAWMTLTALAWSLTPSLDKLAMERSSPAFHARMSSGRAARDEPSFASPSVSSEIAPSRFPL